MQQRGLIQGCHGQAKHGYLPITALTTCSISWFALAPSLSGHSGGASKFLASVDGLRVWQHSHSMTAAAGQCCKECSSQVQQQPTSILVTLHLVDQTVLMSQVTSSESSAAYSSIQSPEPRALLLGLCTTAGHNDLHFVLPVQLVISLLKLRLCRAAYPNVVWSALPAHPPSPQQPLLQQVIRSQAVRVVQHTAVSRALNPEPSLVC